MASQARLKLLGRENRDIVTLSGLVQDAIFVPADMKLYTERKRFVAVLNRFQWERAVAVDAAASGDTVAEASADARFEDDLESGYTRSFTALTVEGITGARTRSVKMGARDQFLSVMALVPDDKGLTLVPLKMYFSRGRAKLLLGIGRGRKLHDKRQKLKADSAKRDIDAALKSRRGA